MKSGGGSMKWLALLEITFRGASALFALIFFYGHIFKRTFPSLSHSSRVKVSQARKRGSLASAYLSRSFYVDCTAECWQMHKKIYRRCRTSW